MAVVVLLLVIFFRFVNMNYYYYYYHALYEGIYTSIPETNYVPRE